MEQFVEPFETLADPKGRFLGLVDDGEGPTGGVRFAVSEWPKRGQNATHHPFRSRHCGFRTRPRRPGDCCWDRIGERTLGDPTGDGSTTRVGVVFSLCSQLRDERGGRRPPREASRRRQTPSFAEKDVRRRVAPTLLRSNRKPARTAISFSPYVLQT